MSKTKERYIGDRPRWVVTVARGCERLHTMLLASAGAMLGGMLAAVLSFLGDWLVALLLPLGLLAAVGLVLFELVADPVVALYERRRRAAIRKHLVAALDDTTPDASAGSNESGWEAAA